MHVFGHPSPGAGRGAFRPQLQHARAGDLGHLGAQAKGPATAIGADMARQLQHLPLVLHRHAPDAQVERGKLQMQIGIGGLETDRGGVYIGRVGAKLGQGELAGKGLGQPVFQPMHLRHAIGAHADPFAVKHQLVKANGLLGGRDG